MHSQEMAKNVLAKCNIFVNFNLQGVIDQSNFMAVAYTNTPQYFIGKVIRAADDAMMVSFLTHLETVYFWPKEPVVEDVERNQIFLRNIKATQVSKSD